MLRRSEERKRCSGCARGKRYAKSVKNRVHLDVRAAPRLDGDERRAFETEANRLEALGATRAYRVEPDKATMESGFITMRDPEGNEFCLD